MEDRSAVKICAGSVGLPGAWGDLEDASVVDERVDAGGLGDGTLACSCGLLRRGQTESFYAGGPKECELEERICGQVQRRKAADGNRLYLLKAKSF